MRTRILGILACLSLIAFLQPSASAIFLKPDLEKIPVDKLVKNLQEAARKDTKNVNVRYNLARAHAMAYALKVDSVEVSKKRPSDGAWLGFTPAARAPL